MSWKVQKLVWERSRARPLGRLVELAIADHAHDDGSGAYPSLMLLASKTGLSRREVKRLVIELETLGEVTIVRDPGKVSHYVVHPGATGVQRTPVQVRSTTSPPGPPGPETGVWQSPTGVPQTPEPIEPPNQSPQPQLVAIYQELYGRAPSAKKRAYLLSIEQRWDPDRAAQALRTEHQKDPDPRTICGRMEGGLRNGEAFSQRAAVQAPDVAAAVAEARRKARRELESQLWFREQQSGRRSEV